MMVFEQIATLEAKNNALEKELRRERDKKRRRKAIEEDWRLVKTWAASFGVRLLIAGGVIFFFIVLPSALIGGV